MTSAPEPYDVASGPAAVLLGVSQSSLARWAEQGLIPHSKTPGGHLRFRRSDLEAFIAQLAQPTPASAS